MSAFPFKGLGYEMGALHHGQGTTAAGKRAPCADFELNAMECLEAYGMVKGRELCTKFIEDLEECRHQTLTVWRSVVMREERYKKLLKGEIKWANRWGKPYDGDSYVGGTFFP